MEDFADKKAPINHPWSLKYWDLHNQIYWDPKYIGLSSVPKKQCEIVGDHMLVPLEQINIDASLYTRQRKYDALKEHCLSWEEILNHLFDITFAIAPSQIIHQLFAEPLGIAANGSCHSFGREIKQRFGWKKSENTTTPDGIFFSDQTLIGVELKLKATSSPEQIIKYVSLFVQEELLYGKRNNHGLLYILPEQGIAKHWQHCGLSSSTIDGSFLDKHPLAKPRRVVSLLNEHEAEFRRILDNLMLHVISWSQLLEAIEAILSRLDVTNMGEETIYKLLHGFRHQLLMHRDTGIS